MSDARRYAVWPEPRSRSRSLEGNRPSVPHGTNFSRWHFNPWTICFPGLLLPSESCFPQSMHYALLVSLWPNKQPPLLNTSQLRLMCILHGAQKVLSNNGFQMANCFCCLSQNVMVCLAHCCQELQQQSWKTARFFLQNRDQDQMIKTKDLMIQDQEQDFHFCPRGASRPNTLVSRTTSLENP